ncbi:MAG: glycosyltransferase [Nitrososphaeria archaeon]|nr:glycosyltransferase [Conexivisphaerales archaeon]
MKYKWYFSVYGTGLGHISRSLWLAKHLEGEKFFSSWGEALKISSSYYRAFYATPIDVVWTEEGRMSFKKTLRGFYRPFSTLAIQIREERNRIKELNPSAVISDSRISPLIASRLTGKKSALIINQAKILFPLRNSVYLFLERLFGEILGVIWDLADIIISPDLPPPYSISKFSMELKTLEKKVIYAGFFADLPYKEIECQNRGIYRVYAPISGPAPTKKLVVDLLIKTSKMLPDNYKVTVSLGDYSKKDYRYEDGRLKIIGWDENREENIACSDALIVRGGLTTIGEGIIYGKPMIVFPIALHGEQEQNALRVQELGLGLYMDQYKTKPKELLEGLQLLLEEDKFRKNIETPSKIARSINTQQKVKSILEGLVHE